MRRDSPSTSHRCSVGIRDRVRRFSDGWRFGSAGGNLQERRSPVRGDEHHQEPGGRYRGGSYTTNDLPGCPDGGLLLGTDKNDRLHGKDGDDEIRALGGRDVFLGGVGNDAIYMGPGDDSIQAGDHREGDGDDVIYGGSGDDLLQAGKGADVMYGGDGSDDIFKARDRQRDKLYCGEGKDRYYAEKIDYVDSSCEKGKLVDTGGPPLLLLAGAALCSALMMLRYVIRSA